MTDMEKTTMILAAHQLKEYCASNSHCIECPFDEELHCGFYGQLPNQWILPELPADIDLPWDESERD